MFCENRRISYCFYCCVLYVGIP
uniref:Uncharacterized protein n=1 Tax=Arundo donax TaxID=35708 RepID=A0A0A9GLN3_ARUDO